MAWGAPVLADDTGMAVPVAEGAKACVRWAYTVEPDPKDANKVRLIFTFENTCDKTVFVLLGKQTGETDRATYPGFHEVPPKTTIGGSASTPTNLVYQTKYKYLNFWVFESDTRMAPKAGNQPQLDRCNPKIERKPHLRAKYPACPASFSFGG